MDNEIIVSFLGDILSYECQNKKCRVCLNKYDFTDYFIQTKSIFEHSDYVVGSLESPLAGKRARYTYSSTSFNTPDDILLALKRIGVNMLTTGNNHALDRGVAGLKRTIEVLNKYGMEHTGTAVSADERPFFVKEIKGVRIAFLSYSYGTNSAANGYMIHDGEDYLVNLTRLQDLPPNRSLLKTFRRWLFFLMPKELREQIRPEKFMGIIADCVHEKEIDCPRNKSKVNAMLKAISEAKTLADVVIFCLHSGGQFNSEVSGYTKWMIDLIAETGVDAIITNHAHRALPIEMLPNGCVVAYSLGNFSFTPGVGYYVNGVDADISKVLHLKISASRKVVDGFCTDLCKTVVDSNGLAHVVPYIVG